MKEKTKIIADDEKYDVFFTLSKCENGDKKWWRIEAFYTISEQYVGFVLLNTKAEVEYQCGIFDYSGIPALDDYIENELFKKEVGDWRVGR